MKSMNAAHFSSSSIAYRMLRTAPVSKQEQVRLANLAKLGDSMAHRALVSTNLRLVMKFALHYKKRYYYLSDLDVFDLVNEGVLGCAAAIEHYDSTKNPNFLSYMSWWLRKYMSAYIENLASGFRGSDKTVFWLSFDAPTVVSENGDSFNLLDSIVAEEDIPDIELDITKALSYLSADDRELIDRAYGIDGNEPESYADISRRTKRGRNSVQRQAFRALNTMRVGLGLQAVQSTDSYRNRVLNKKSRHTEIKEEAQA